MSQQIDPQHQAVPFVVKHYAGTDRPVIKGNGFDGLEVGTDRQEAQEFVDWLNAALGVKTGDVCPCCDSTTYNGAKCTACGFQGEKP